MERVLNDLYDYEGLKIYQYEDGFKFSLDSILLAEFVEIKQGIGTIVDFCTGNAPVPMILSTKCDAKIYGFEIQEEIFNLGRMSVKKNKLEDRIRVINANLSDAFEYILPESVDVVTCNPPYFKVNGNKSLINETKEKAIARHEITMDLDSLVASAKYVLKNKATFYLVHRCDRLEEILKTLDKYGFKVKKLQFVYAGFNKDAIMVLIKATKNGKIGNLKVGKPIDILNCKTYKGIFEEGE